MEVREEEKLKWEHNKLNQKLDSSLHYNFLFEKLGDLAAGSSIGESFYQGQSENSLPLY